MTPIVTGTREVLMNKMQCLRDATSALSSEIDSLIARKDECCTSESSSETSSSETSYPQSYLLWTHNITVDFSNNEVVEFSS